MGMSDSQFKAFVRFLLSALREMWREEDPERKQAKMTEIMDYLQKAIED